ncbi:MAG: hypothetical protein ACK5JM_03525 [Rhodoblastus sp.]
MTAFPIDIISDVAAAADPQRAEATRRRLEALGGQSANDFTRLVETADRVRSGQTRAPVFDPPVVSQRPALRRQSPESALASAYRSLGGVLLQKTFETMLADRGGAIAAKGSAASFWKSMLAQQLADRVSDAVFSSPGAGVRAAMHTPDRRTDVAMPTNLDA